MKKHTPGPWEVYSRTNKAGQTLSLAIRNPAEHYGAAIARMGSYHPVQQEADARLIAAAPEMYDELVRIADGFEAIAQGKVRGRELTPWEQERLLFIGQILAKAKGG